MKKINLYWVSEIKSNVFNKYLLCHFYQFIYLTILEFDIPSQIINLISCIVPLLPIYLWNGTMKFKKVLSQEEVFIKVIICLCTFLFCMLKLALLIQEHVDNGSWKPIKISKNGPSISYIFFTHDCLLCIKASCSRAKLIQDTIQKFCLVGDWRLILKNLVSLLQRMFL